MKFILMKIAQVGKKYEEVRETQLKQVNKGNCSWSKKAGKRKDPLEQEEVCTTTIDGKNTAVISWSSSAPECVGLFLTKVITMRAG
jgi:hypothetical protein